MAQFNVFYCEKGRKNEITAETLDEALSICVALFNQNCELHAIEKDGKIIFEHCEIYKLIGKVIY
jgi:hypothetical protein